VCGVVGRIRNLHRPARVHSTITRTRTYLPCLMITINTIVFIVVVVTFRVKRSRGEMFCSHACLSVCLSLAAFPHYCTDPDITWKNGRGCPLLVDDWADLQSVHGFRCYSSIVPNAKCQRMRVLAVCLAIIVIVAAN